MSKNSKTIGLFLVVIVLMLIVFRTIATKKSLAINSLESEIRELKDESLKNIERLEKEYQVKLDSIQNVRQDIKKKEDSIVYVYEKQINYINNSSISANIDLFSKYLSEADSVGWGYIDNNDTSTIKESK